MSVSVTRKRAARAGGSDKCLQPQAGPNAARSVSHHARETPARLHRAYTEEERGETAEHREVAQEMDEHMLTAMTATQRMCADAAGGAKGGGRTVSRRETRARARE